MLHRHTQRITQDTHKELHTLTITQTHRELHTHTLKICKTMPKTEMGGVTGGARSHHQDTVNELLVVRLTDIQRAGQARWVTDSV